MSVLLVVVGSVLLMIVQVALLERRSRELQRERFGAALRAADLLCRRNGWWLIEATFHAGWLTGHGSISWRNAEGLIHTSPVTVDGLATTRQAAHPW